MFGWISETFPLASGTEAAFTSCEITLSEPLPSLLLSSSSFSLFFSFFFFSLSLFAFFYFLSFLLPFMID